MNSHQLQKDDFVWLLGTLCQLNRIPFDPELALQQCPPPPTSASLLDACERIGLKAGFMGVSEAEWATTPMPCVAFMRPQSDLPGRDAAQDAGAGDDCAEPEADPPKQGEAAWPAPGRGQLSHLSAVRLRTETPDAEEGGTAAREDDAYAREAGDPSEPPLTHQPALLVKSDGNKILLFPSRSASPITITHRELAQRYEPAFLFFRAEGASERGNRDPDLDVLEKPRFGLRWFFPELLRHKKTWRDILLGSLALQVVGLATPLCTQVVIDKVVAHNTLSTLWVVACAMLLFAGFSAVMSWLRQYMVLHTGNRIDAVLGSLVFRHLLRLPLPYFEKRPTGVLVARLRGVEQIREFLSGAAFSALLDLPFLLIALTIMLIYSWQLTLIATFLLGVICVLSAVVTPIFRQRLNRQFQSGARSQAFLTEYVAGMNTVKSLQMEPQLEIRYGELISRFLSDTFSTRQVANAYNAAANSIEQILGMGVLIVGALLVMQNEGFTIGMLVAFQMFTSRMSQPMLRMVGLWQELQQTQVSIARLADIMDMPTEPHTLTPMRERTGGGKIDITGVSFRYSEEYPFLFRGLSLGIAPGKLTVIMGPSGCGKSTLTKLLMGFYQPTEGQILLDGRDIRRLSANELRCNFGVVPQETMLFSGSIYDNLMAAQPYATFQDIVEACKLAEIHSVIEGLPQGYQTELGEHGVGLSGGQRQRLAIARALLKRPKILIFDEATSNLDSDTAESFGRTVNRLKARATILFIAHQLPKTLQVDEIVRFMPPAPPPTATQREHGQKVTPLQPK